MESAVESGHLENALHEVMLDDVRYRMKNTFETALESGNLADALSNIGKKQAPPNIEGMRSKLKMDLISAAESGTLDRAFEGLRDRNMVDLRLKMRSTLETACNSGALSKALAQIYPDAPAVTASSLEESRLKMKATLESACTSGALATALSKINVGENDLEEARLRLKATMESACVNGELETALNSVKVTNQRPDAAAGNVDDIKAEVRDILRNASVSGDLARELGSLRPAPPPGAPPQAVVCRRNLLDDFAAAGNLEAPMKSMPASNVALLLRAVSQRDRRIGALSALASEVRRQITDRDDQAARLQAQLETVRRDSDQLSAELKRQQILVDQAETMSLTLRQQQNKLVDDLEGHDLKHRHRMLDLDLDPIMNSARSELSTVCTVRDLPSPAVAPTPKDVDKGRQLSLYDGVQEGSPAAFAAAPPMIS